MVQALFTYANIRISSSVTWLAPKSPLLIPYTNTAWKFDPNSNSQVPDISPVLSRP
jgi:hypothetical protein